MSTAQSESIIMSGKVDIKDLLELDLSLHEEIIPPIMNGTSFDADDVDGDDVDDEEDISEYTTVTQNDESMIENKEKSILEFLRGLMSHEQSAKCDMIKTLTEQISILKQELTHKQTIIDALLNGGYHIKNWGCNHNNSNSNNNNNYNHQRQPPQQNGASLHQHQQHTVSETLLGVRTLIEEQYTQNQHRVGCGTPHKPCRIQLKPQKPVTQLLTEIKDLMETHMIPDSNRNHDPPPKKVYRIKFNVDGRSLVSCRNTVQSDAQ